MCKFSSARTRIQIQCQEFTAAGRLTISTHLLQWRQSKGCVDVMVKAKPDEADILRVYQALLDKGGITLHGSIADYLRGSDYSVPNLKEAVLFRDFEVQLRPFLPRSLGVFVERRTPTRYG